MRYRLKHLEVAGFRGACEQVCIPLDKPLVVIYGPNGAGKSTLTTAIEWALFPKEAALLTEHGIRERTNWEVQHVHANAKPHVRLTLCKGSEELSIEHRGSRTKKQGKQSPDPTTSLKCVYADFNGLAYIHQETIRDFLIGRPKPREEAFQRLLGAGWIQDLAEAMDRAAKKLRCDEADQRVASLNQQIYDRMQEILRLLKQAENSARQVGLKDPWEEAAQKEIRKVDDAIKTLCGRLGIEAPPLPEAEPFKDYSNRLSPILQNIRGQGPAKTHTELSTRATQLEGARASYKTAQDAVNAKPDELKTTEQGVRTRGELSGKIAALAAQRDDLQAKLDNLNLERSVMRAALDYFKTSASAKACPACLRDAVPEDVVDRLAQRLEAESTAQEKKLGAEVQGAEGHLRTLNILAEEWKQAEEQLSKQREGLEAILGRQMRDDESPLQVADAEIERLNTEIRALTEAVRRLQSRVSEVENIAKRADQVGEILALQQRGESLAQIRQTSEWQAMTEAQQALSRREQAFKLASHAVRQLAARLAQHNLDRAREPITTIYRELTKRADFPDISIDPEKKYTIEVTGDSGLQRVTAILNQTDLDALAIAVVAGMATSFPEVHDLDFLILDDPSQGMDPEVTARLAEVIGSVSEKIQVLIATPDPILFEKLKKSTRAKRLIQLKPRDSQSPAPFVQVQSVSGD